MIKCPSIRVPCCSSVECDRQVDQLPDPLFVKTITQVLDSPSPKVGIGPFRDGRGNIRKEHGSLKNSKKDPKAKIVISIVHAITTSIRESIRQKSGHRMVLLGTLQGMARAIERQPHILRRCVRSEMKDLNQGRTEPEM